MLQSPARRPAPQFNSGIFASHCFNLKINLMHRLQNPPSQPHLYSCSDRSGVQSWNCVAPHRHGSLVTAEKRSKLSRLIGCFEILITETVHMIRSPRSLSIFHQESMDRPLLTWYVISAMRKFPLGCLQVQGTEIFGRGLEEACDKDHIINGRDHP